MMQFLYCVRPTRVEMLSNSTDEEDRIVADHFEYLKRLTECGTVLLAGRTLNTDDSAFGLVVLLARSREDAHRIMQEDPAVRGGVFEAELFPYRLALVAETILAPPLD